MFIRVMAFLSLISFSGNTIWALCIGFDDTNIATIPLFISGVFLVIFVPLWQIRRERKAGGGYVC